VQLASAAGTTLSGAVVREAEGAEYGAARCSLDGRALVFRVARTTPTKIGQFVTLWQRAHPGAEIAPLDAQDAVDVVVVFASSAQQHGYFIFSKAVMVAQGVFSSAAHAGKRAFRLYPPWSHPVAAQAVKSQRWQSACFLHCSADGSADPVQARRLLGLAAAR
jgi:hypothetical protein